MKLHPGDKLGINDGAGDATVGIRENGDWCYAPLGRNDAKRMNPPLCASCRAVRFGDRCPNCGN